MGSCHVSKTATTWPILRKFSWKLFSKSSLPAARWSTMIRNWLLTKKPGHNRLSSQVGTKWKLETQKNPHKTKTLNFCEFLQFSNKCRKKHLDVSAHSTSLRHSALVMPWHAVREVWFFWRNFGTWEKKQTWKRDVWDVRQNLLGSKIIANQILGCHQFNGNGINSKLHQNIKTECVSEISDMTTLSSTTSCGNFM